MEKKNNKRDIEGVEEKKERSHVFSLYASGSNVLGEDNAQADIKSKRALADGDAGPSHGSSDEDRPPKRLRSDPNTEMSIDEHV
ncbi:hypothetical protein GBA52_000415 [Prunus armeniaca]|nr:hypothetical protein GBA52_000415 [Prunus armeniaca]